MADEAIVDVGAALADRVELSAWNLQDASAVPCDAAGGVRCIVQHHALAHDRARLQHSQDDAAAVLAPRDLDVAVEHEPEPVSRRGFMEEVIARLVCHGRAAREY